MIEERRSIHLICNAHLDPVWMWEWEEGVAETISTFRTAAELCENNDTFIFNHNEAILYEWVRKYAPSLFKRIQKLVKARKWHIMGGWFIQPDCNMPSGESFVRQILLGKAYFKEHFGVEPTTAINFDSFGHTRGLVQILAKSGYDSYLFGRPTPEHQKLPGEDFVWVGYDGSEIMATRFKWPYCTPLGKARESIIERIGETPGRKVLALLWGVGNHGGGPSRSDLRNINGLIKESKYYNINHSTPEIYFKALRRMRNELPKHKKDLNPWAVGCYTSMVEIKQKHRLLENEIYSLEKMASAAFCQRLMKYPYEQIKEALTDLMFAEFHDVLPGSCIQPAAEASLRLLSHGLEIVSRLKAQAFFALSGGQKAAKAGEIPILVYNPHPFKVKQPVECELSLPDANLSNTFTEVKVFRNGKPVPSQVEHELSNCDLDWRKMVVFDAELQPNQMNRFDCRTRVIPTKPAGLLKSRNGKIVFKTRQLDVVVNTRTGLVERYRINGVECISKNAFEPIVMHDNADCWGQLSKSFSKVAGRFKLMSKEAGTRFSGLEAGRVDSVRIIEDGPVRSVIEAVFSYGDSFICQRYKLPKSGTEIEVETRVYWNEKNRMLKLSVPTIGEGCKYLGQVAYGVGELPSDGKEAVAQKWVAVISKSRNLALTCINDGIYGSDFSLKGLRLTLLRSPAYACGPPMEQSTSSPFIAQGRFSPRIDQGERVFRFWFNAGKISQRLKLIDREALTKNEEPFALSFFPQGQGTKPKALAVLSDEVVQITTIKRAEKNNRLIIRLYEPTGKSRTTFLSLPCIRTKIKVDIGGFEIKTLKVNLKTGHIIETGLLERTNVK